MMTQWYVLKTKPKQESRAASNVGQVGLTSFVPTMEGMRGIKPLFPNYIFVQGNLSDPQVYRKVRYSRGVQLVLGDEQGPRAIGAEVIETIRSQTRDGSLIEQKLLFREGAKVRVKRGLLKDLIGIVEKHVPAQKRVDVLFKWWAKTMRASLKCTELEVAV